MNPIDFAGLDVDDGHRKPFAAFDSELPQAPKLKSKGVIAMDITEQFSIAAERKSAQSFFQTLKI